MKLTQHIIRYFLDQYVCVWFDRKHLPQEGDSITVGDMTAVFTKTDKQTEV